MVKPESMILLELVLITNRLSCETASGVNKFTVDTDNGNTNIIGTLTVGDATQINDTLGASGVTTLTAIIQQTLTGNYAADGAF